MAKRPTAPKAIGDAFKGVIGHMASQAWLVGHLDSSIVLLDVVIEEAEENAANFPKDRDCKDALASLRVARNHIEVVSKRLAQIAVGDKGDG